MLSKVKTSIAQFGIIIMIVPTFYFWATWLDCAPIDKLSEKKISVDLIPPDAKCFYISHGTVGFRNHGAISEDLTLFIVVTLLLVILFVLLVYLAISKHGKSRDQRDN
jgi:hypothetical protein